MSDGYISCFRIPMRADVLAICGHTATPQEMVVEANAPNVLRLPIYSCLLSKKVSCPKEKEERIYNVLGYKKHAYTTNYFLVTLDEVYTLFEIMDGEFVIGKRDVPKIVKQKEYHSEVEEEECDSDGELIEETPVEDETTVGYISCNYNPYYKHSELSSHLNPPKLHYVLSKKINNPTAKLELLDKKLRSEYKHIPYSNNVYTLAPEEMLKLFDLFDGEMVISGSK